MKKSYFSFLRLVKTKTLIWDPLGIAYIASIAKKDRDNHLTLTNTIEQTPLSDFTCFYFGQIPSCTCIMDVFKTYIEQGKGVCYFFHSFQKDWISNYTQS